MCDEQTLRDANSFLERGGTLSRRRFGTLSAGAGLSMMLPRAAHPQAVMETDVDVATPDGVADCYLVHPSSGAHAGVIVWPDILGLRPAFRMMGRRLAESGYSVLVVNPFYRGRRAPVVAEGASFQDPDTRNTVLPLAQALNADTHFSDARAFASFLDRQRSVDRNRKLGTTGYCMGGPIVMRTAAAVPDRVGAGASFHGGGLVTDRPDSPHLWVEQMNASFLFAIAESDDQNDPEARSVLREAFDRAGLEAEIEVYSGTQHGWCPPDSSVYDAAQAERAWSRLLVLFDRALA